MDKPPPHYYRFVKDRTCCVCGGYGTHADPIEAAHFVGTLHQKTMKPAKRSHKGIAGWACVPMHRNCHLDFDAHGQSFTHETECWLHMYLVMQLLEFREWERERDGRTGTGEEADR